MGKYKVSFQTEDVICANSKKEAEKIFWDRFDNSIWKAKTEVIN